MNRYLIGLWNVTVQDKITTETHDTLAHQDVPEQCEDVGKRLTPFVGVQHHMTNPVKSIAKDAPCWSLRLFDPNRFDDMAPSTDLVSPAKGYSKDSEQSFQTLFILQMRFFKVKTS